MMRRSVDLLHNRILKDDGYNNKSAHQIQVIQKV